jgi:hypothetical protein
MKLKTLMESKLKTDWTKDELNIAMKKVSWRGAGKFVKVLRAQKFRYGYEMLVLVKNGEQIRTTEYFENLEKMYNENK